jgi:hypothetical protein
MKKNCLLSLFLFFFIVNVNAQIKKGSFIIGGDLTLFFPQIYNDSNHLSATFGKPYNARFQPEIGYFITNQAVIGAKLGVRIANEVYNFSSVQTQTSLSDFSIKSNEISFNPFIRYYFNPNNPFKFFCQLNLSGEIYNSQSSQFFNNKFTTNTWQTSDRLQVDNSIGFNYFIAQNIAIESSINYVYFYRLKYRNNSQNSYAYVLPKPIFNPEIKMKLFLNSDKTNTKILAEKYLKKGNTTYGLMGNLSFSNLYITLNPSMGYFLTNKLLVGSSLDISFQNNIAFYGGISPEMRFYQPITKDVQIILRGATSGGIDFDLSDKKTSPRYRVSYLQFQGGLNKFIAENISIQALVGVNLSDYKNELIFNPNIKFGLQYFMDKQLKIK